MGSNPPQPPPSRRDAGVELQTPNAEPAPPPSVRPEPPAAANPVVIEDPPSVQLHHSPTHGRGRLGWLRIALPIVGLLLVPAIGLIYAATATFGKTAGGETAGDDEAGADGGKAKKGKTKAKSAKATTKPRTDGASECCEKLKELGKTAPIDQRATYLSAAQACEAAPDEDRAFRIARSNVQTAKHEVPEECAP